MPFIVIIISFIGITMRLWKLHNRALWVDEIYQFNCMNGDFKPFWLYQTYGDHTAFPGEYILQYPLVRIFGLNKWGLVGPHLLINLIGFYLLYKVCRIYCKSTFGYVVAFLIYILNDNLIFHSLEFRPYAVLPVLALSSLYFSHRLWAKDFQSSYIKMFLTGVLFFVTINYHIYGIAICLLPFIFVSLCNIKKICSFPWTWWVIVGICSFSVWLWYANFNHLGFSPNLKAQSYEDPFQFIDDPTKHFVSFLKAVLGNLIGIKKGRAIWIVSLILFFLPQENRLKKVIFAIFLIILPIALILYFDIRSHYWFLDRQFIWVCPWVSIFIAWIWDSFYLNVGSFLKKERRSRQS